MKIALDNKASVLIVDDERINIDILSDFLADSYRVYSASNGIEALRVLEKNNYEIDLILLDVVMPLMDGYETCQILKSKKETADIPLLFVTANRSVEDEEYGLSLGAADYIFKPYRPSAIKLKVHNHISVKKNKENLSRLNANLQEELAKLIQKNIQNELCDDVFFLNDTITIDIKNALIQKNNQETVLTKKELELLSLFLLRPKKILSKEEIEYALWNGENKSDSSVKTLVRKVRLKIGQEYIECIKNIGYKFLK